MRANSRQKALCRMRLEPLRIGINVTQSSFTSQLTCYDTVGTNNPINTLFCSSILPFHNALASESILSIATHPPTSNPQLQLSQ